MAKTKKEPSLEETFQELETIIEKMQDREVTLEDSFSLYEQGIQKLKFCNEKIDHVEKKMLLLNKQGELEAFDE
ncbi:MAG: exodeoxyribonuclease VII small subunit [Lachnospiraceae bacterium]|jgi:exodeoxyribonuclease VII small subunit|nr:exodeoxyribonuclease VII small subunit [Lachnospiraceae bacterium]